MVHLSSYLITGISNLMKKSGIVVAVFFVTQDAAYKGFC